MPLRFLFAGLTAMVAISVSAPAHADCDAHALARSLGIENETAYTFASSSLPDGRIFAAGIPTTVASGDDSVMPVRVAMLSRCLVRPTWTGDETLGSQGNSDDPVSAAIGGADGLSVRVLPQTDLRGGTWMRVGVIAQFGEDFATTTEVVLLYRIADAGSPTLVWRGIGSTNETRNGECVIDHVVEFRSVDDHTIARVDRASATPPRSRDCRASAVRALRISVP